MIVEGRSCLNCKHCEYQDICVCLCWKCELETQIPFFDADNYIADPREDSCPKWEERDGK